MEKQMRRMDKRMDEDLAKALLKRGIYGILSTVSRDGTPYGIPLNYYYENGFLYMHGAGEGHKLENIRYNNHVSFCVVGDIEVLESKFSTNYESIVVFGKADIIQDEQKRRDVAVKLMEKYCSNYMAEAMAYIDRAIDKTVFIRIEIESFTGKIGKI